MATCRDCKDCLHYELCGVFDYISPDECGFYTERSRFVELPCRIGDVVYRICPINDSDACHHCPWKCDDCYNLSFVNDDANFIRKGKANDYNWILKRAQYFGKLYFITKEEAEQEFKKLKGRWASSGNL